MADTEQHSGSSITFMRVEPYEHRGIALSCPVLTADGYVPDAFSGYGDNTSPPLAWSAIIEAQSYALVVEDPDAPYPEPFIHWLLWNIPGTATSLPQAISPTAHPPELQGAVQGRNGMDRFGWFGPRPPEGHGLHRYHFQLFALSGPLEFGPETMLDQLVNALKGMTIAKGELIGLYEKPALADEASPARTGGYGSDPHSANQFEAENARGGLDGDDRDRHAPHSPDGEVRHRGGGEAGA